MIERITLSAMWLGAVGCDYESAGYFEGMGMAWPQVT